MHSLHTRKTVRRAACAMMSLLALWHGTALLLGTAPPSYLRSQLMPLFRSYIRTLHLDGHWAFFAPDPSAGRLLRYRVEPAGGASTELEFTAALKRGDAAYLRFTTLAGNIDTDAPALMGSVGRALCRRHAALAPQRIHFVGLQQVRITPEQVESGLDALDATLLERIELAAVPCT